MCCYVKHNGNIVFLVLCSETTSESVILCCFLGSGVRHALYQGLYHGRALLPIFHGGLFLPVSLSATVLQVRLVYMQGQKRKEGGASGGLIPLVRAGPRETQVHVHSEWTTYYLDVLLHKQFPLYSVLSRAVL